MARARLALLASAISACLAIAGIWPLAAGSEQQPAPVADQDFAPVQFALHDIPPAALAALGNGAVTAERVFGTDDRIPITDTTVAPWRTIAQLVIFDQRNEIVSTCSGVMLNTNVVLTAAHCLFDPRSQSYVYSLLVVPGENGPAFPFDAAVARQFAIPQGWVNSGDIRFDFGLAFIPGSPFPSTLGPFLPVAAVPDAYFYDPGTIIATAGYPGDKLPGTQWFTAGFFFFVDDEAIYTEMDAFAGQSGSPIYTWNDARDELFIVGVFSSESQRSNYAVRFTASHINALVQYCASFGCTIQTKQLAGNQGPAPTATRTWTPTPTPPVPSTKTPPPTKSPTAAPSPTTASRVVVPLVASDR